MVVDVVAGGAAEVVVEVVVVVGGSGVSVGAAEVVDMVVVEVVLALVVVLVGTAVTAGSDASSATGAGDKLCASTAASAGSGAVVAGLLSLSPDEQAAANSKIIVLTRLILSELLRLIFSDLPQMRQTIKDL